VVDRWVRKLHSSQSYAVKSDYNNLTIVEVIHNEAFNHVLSLKAVSFKVNIFI